MGPDRHELAKGKACQAETQDAFDRDDFYTAYQLYAEAEVHYRKAYSKPGDRQYFMQLSAIRCLEYSLEDRPGLIAQYRAEAQRFLSEWTPDKITIAISYRRISEALVFREFRETTWEGVGSNAFREANLAIEVEDFERARVLLDECIARYAGSSNPERDAIVAIARCKQEISVARLEVKRRRFNRDLKKIASAYLRAARASALPAGTLSKQRDRIASYRALALSDVLKYRAASRLRPRTNTIKATIHALEDAERFLRRAVHYAHIALGTYHEMPRSHARHLEYSHLTVLERLSLLKFMETREEQYFNTAMRSWEGALQKAKQLAIEDEANLFPNRFYSLKDLELEELFIKAAKTFRDAHFEACVTFLKEWIDNYPDEYLWGWRYSNVRVRMLGASILSHIWASDSPNRSTLSKQMTELRSLAEKEPIGAAASYFAEEIPRIVAQAGNRSRIEARWDELCPYFLLDATVESYIGHSSETEPFDSLPEHVRWGLCQPAYITASRSEQARRDFLASVEAILGYICDYDAQWSCPEEPLPRPAIDEFLGFIRRFDWVKTGGGERLLDQLNETLGIIQNATSADEFTTIYEQARHVVRRLLKFVPLVVSIDSKITQTAQ